ncbi:hypothetical protein GCM10011375_22670 [Hymenobacter qilianensis]|uniref:Uncharacterized protein n=2 Tax=Hymenobacter qilianensis TaxID=1385715 RepID=A0ACB5PSA7_9BACT|nr:hypothetical protein [Hymenobacter qilianensis]QNP52378.1 hypothetical protein H9L05_00840 [Hymenobacter qilianensis]GGF67116.1 hypothetical protein GCM10011375_22670 [Hymenobacter qilianensis]
MLLEQRRLTQITQLALRPHGLYICRKDRRGLVTLEVEMPYEEVLPVRVERRQHRVISQWQVLGFVFLLHALNNGLRQADDLYTLIAFGVSIAAMAIYWYGCRNWWNHFILSTTHARVVLVDRPNERKALFCFTEALEQRTKDYLRENYGSINPLGLIEPQLQRLRWLHKLEVLTDKEARALSTRLTGRMDNSPLLSMGQELEAPYAN